MLEESGLRFDFSNALKQCVFDLQGVTRVNEWKAVDFVVEEQTQVLLIEVKNPSQPCVPPAQQAKFDAKMKNGKLAKDLVRKMRDSYFYLHLMDRDHKEFVGVVVIGVLGDSTPGLLALKDKLLALLRQEADAPWKRRYVRDCVVVTPETWGRAFPQYPLTTAADI